MLDIFNNNIVDDEEEEMYSDNKETQNRHLNENQVEETGMATEKGGIENTVEIKVWNEVTGNESHNRDTVETENDCNNNIEVASVHEHPTKMGRKMAMILNNLRTK